MCKNEIHIYIAKISDFSDNTTLPHFAEIEIKKITNQNVINQKKAAYGLLRKMTKEIFGFEDDLKHLQKTENGKPISNKYHMSISHSKDVVAIALSSENIGIDIEKIDQSKNIERLTKFITHPQEKEIEISCMKDLIKVWTKKEAKFKFNGEKRYIAKDINALDFDAKTYDFKNGNDQYILSVVASNLENIKITNLL